MVNQFIYLTGFVKQPTFLVLVPRYFCIVKQQYLKVT